MQAIEETTRIGAHYDYPPTSLRTATHSEIVACNLADALPDLLAAIAAADFVAVDCEFSGLGAADRRKLRAKDLQVRYDGVSNLALSYALYAIGISCFTRTNAIDNGNVTYAVKSFDVLTRRLGTHSIDSESMAFLVQNEFDLNRQAAHGCPLYIGNLADAKGLNDAARANVTLLRQLWPALQKSPLVMHNGLLDLMFLYVSLHGRPPRDLPTWQYTLATQFPRGVWDTKLISESVEPEGGRSHLSYLFRKCERWQDTRRVRGLPAFGVQFEPSLVRSTHAIDTAALHLYAQHRRDSNDEDGLLEVTTKQRRNPTTCPTMMQKGVCYRMLMCEYTHDLDAVLDDYFLRNGGEFRAPPPPPPVVATAPSIDNGDAFSMDAAAGMVDAGYQEDAALWAVDATNRKRTASAAFGDVDDAAVGQIETADIDVATANRPKRRRVESSTGGDSPAAAEMPATTTPDTRRPNMILDADMADSSDASAHSGHADAYMTAYIFAHYLHSRPPAAVTSGPQPAASAAVTATTPTSLASILKSANGEVAPESTDGPLSPSQAAGMEVDTPTDQDGSAFSAVDQFRNKVYVSESAVPLSLHTSSHASVPASAYLS
ncbi:CAF1 family ribonuclease-domain-containing protein [Blastocladiella britannica]|nr:CAF1 family ribonuclease-domain-containing protein [Blastocladiella britannica]